QRRVRGGRRRNPLSRRDRRSVPGSAGEASAGLGIGRNQASRRLSAHPRRRQGGGGHQPQSVGSHQGTTVPGGSVLPALRGSAPPHPASQPAGRPRHAGGTLRQEVLSARAANPLHFGSTGTPATPFLAGQHSGAQERGAPGVALAAGTDDRREGSLVRRRNPS